MSGAILDLSGLKCPLPVLRTRKALGTMATGARLEVRCTDPMSAIDIPNLLHQTGDVLEMAAREGDRYTFVIVKAGARSR